ncbi:hypothetical protein Hsar01_02003 [Haloferula sargassicola]|uniref:Uncharacterized protein n=1 Tax=Haloferula sargassicola TaxID=490096 RepID=A0ABP9UTV3_9BACT
MRMLAEFSEWAEGCTWFPLQGVAESGFEMVRSGSAAP